MRDARTQPSRTELDPFDFGEVYWDVERWILFDQWWQSADGYVALSYDDDGWHCRAIDDGGMPNQLASAVGGSRIESARFDTRHRAILALEALYAAAAVGGPGRFTLVRCIWQTFDDEVRVYRLKTPDGVGWSAHWREDQRWVGDDTVYRTRSEAGDVGRARSGRRAFSR